jgi:membrane protein
VVEKNVASKLIAVQPRSSTRSLDRAQSMLNRTRKILENTLENYLVSESLTRGAAIAFYSVTSLIPVLVIVIAIAGLAFGEEAARGAIVRELAALIGSDSAKLIQGAIESAYNSGSNGFALIFGTIILILTASGVFGELQAALNAIWKVEAPTFSISRLMRSRAASLGLVIGLGFLLLVSLVIEAGVRATSGYIDQHFRNGAVFLVALNMVASFVLTWMLFAAIYKVLPDKPLDWRDVLFGAFVTTSAFEGGKSLIGLYLGTSTVISSYGAAGALASVLLWIYYSAQIFLLGASFTKACAVSERRRRKKEEVRAKM